jgi:pimeloyl-ACP methyl ester carboxylesterase
MEDVLAFAQAINVDRFTSTGNSHGATVGWYLARQRPDVLKCLISVSGSPHAHWLASAFSEGRERIRSGNADPDAIEAAAWSVSYPTSDAFRLARR